MQVSRVTGRIIIKSANVGMQRPNATLPVGLTSLEPMPHGYRRWNGAVWADIQVDAYNRELDRIRIRHEAGFRTQALVDGLYNLAYSFDSAGAPPVWLDSDARSANR